jgi:opacity protein-like surface antigen
MSYHLKSSIMLLSTLFKSNGDTRALLCACAAFAAPYAAAETAGNYASVYLGYSDPSEVTIDSGPLLDQLTLDRDLSFGLALGRPVRDSLRVEMEYMTRRNDADALPALKLDALDGRLELQTLMLNLVADFPLNQGGLVPYFGLGVGWANAKFNDIGTSFLRINGDDNGFAVQGVAGIALPMSEQLSLTLDVRYLRTDDLEYIIRAGETLQGESEAENVGVMAGLRFRF